MSDALFNAGDVVYFKNTNLRERIITRLYYTADMVRFKQGMYAQEGWRYEIESARGLHYFEWQFSKEPTVRNPTLDNGWEELRERYKEA